MDPTEARPPPGQSGQCSESCPGVEMACHPQLEVGIGEMNSEMVEKFGCLRCMREGMHAGHLVNKELRQTKVEKSLIFIEGRYSCERRSSVRIPSSNK